MPSYPIGYGMNAKRAKGLVRSAYKSKAVRKVVKQGAWRLGVEAASWVPIGGPIIRVARGVGLAAKIGRAAGKSVKLARFAASKGGRRALKVAPWLTPTVGDFLPEKAPSLRRRKPRKARRR